MDGLVFSDRFILYWYSSNFAVYDYLGTKISETASFIDPEILEIDSEKMKRFFKEQPKLAKYKMAIDDVQRLREHTLSEKEEKILASFGLTSGTPSSVYGMFTNAEMPRAEVKLSNGETIKLLGGI